MAERLPAVLLVLLCTVLVPAGAEGQPPAAQEPEPEVQEPPAGAEEPEDEEEDDPDRIAFDLRLEEGRGTVTGSAGELELRREDYAVLTGGVVVHYQDVTLRADRAEVDLSTREVVATGDVVFDQGPRRLAGSTLTFDLDAKTGTLTEATAYVDPDYYFTGDEIAKVDENVYVVTNGVFTSCEQEVPDWSFRLGRARVEVDAYARVRNASMRVKRLPVFYTPYILWPTKEDRTAGLLVPNFGYTERRGTYLGMAYYQPIGRSYDATFFLDGYGEGFVGLGNELRYHPTEGTAGRFEGYAIRETEPLAVAGPGGQDDPVVGGEDDEWRWRMELDHVSDDLPLGLRGVVDWTEYSDFQFFQDFERDFDRNSRRFEDSKAFLTGNWGSHLVNLLVRDRETFTRNRIITDRQLPALEYQLRSTPVWTTPLWGAPLYLSVESSLAYLDVDRSAVYDKQYGRADLFPEVSIPLEPAPWLSLSVRGGYRLTWWGDSLETDRSVVQETGDAFTGESVTRSVPTVGADLIGPSFARVFDAELGPFARFMHLIEPRVSYSFVDEFDRTRQVPSFDSVDRLFSGNVARVSLTQRLKAKPPEEEGGSAREILTFELAQRYSFDDEQPLQRGAATLEPDAEILESQRSPLEATLRFAPSDTTNVRAEWRYSTLFNELTSSAIAAEHRFGPHDASVRYTTRFRPQDGETQSDQIRLGAGVAVLPSRLSVRAAIDYDLEESQLQEQRYFIDWTSQCYSVRLEFRDFQVGQIQDTDYRVAFTLKNVGTFLDLTGRLE